MRSENELHDAAQALLESSRLGINQSEYTAESTALLNSLSSLREREVMQREWLSALRTVEVELLFAPNDIGRLISQAELLCRLDQKQEAHKKARLLLESQSVSDSLTHRAAIARLCTNLGIAVESSKAQVSAHAFESSAPTTLESEMQPVPTVDQDITHESSVRPVSVTTDVVERPTPASPAGLQLNPLNFLLRKPNRDEAHAAGMVVAVAGRRIDPPNANPASFPLARRMFVARGIQTALRRLNAVTVVSSAACGSDLLAINAAHGLGIRCRIILPYRSDWFLEDSVSDRPGRWNILYEHAIAEAKATGDLIVLKVRRNSDGIQQAVNDAIASEVQRLARVQSSPNSSRTLSGLIIWEGVPCGPDDPVANILHRLETEGARIEQVLTLPAH